MGWNEDNPKFAKVRSEENVRVDPSTVGET
jgi:hypothetical protein